MSQQQTTQVQGYQSVQMAQGSLTIMPSSWIRDIDYNTLTNELRIDIRGKWYGPWIVSPRKYMKFIQGKAVPITTDKKRPPRWAKGVGPSLGAAYHKYIKIGGFRAKVSRRIAEFKAKLNPAIKGIKVRGILGQKVTQKYTALRGYRP